MITRQTEGTRYSLDTMPDVQRIAMWSGPRNISTALMRSWGSRTDTSVCDEPFYGHYLSETGYTYHPGYQEILEHHETDWQKVVDFLSGPVPHDKKVFYQKQMAHHLLSHIPLDWTDTCINVFLIRDPREMLLSLLEFFEKPSVDETGLPQQLQLFQREWHRTGTAPAVIDARDLLLQPPAMLALLCERIGVAFDENMLRWEPGPRNTDGIWAKYWYANVERTTTFGQYQPKLAELPPQHQGLLAECQGIYDQMAEHKLSLN